MRKTLALFGILAGLAVYIAAFYINAPMDACASHPVIPPSILAGSDFVSSVSNFRKAWVVLVASRCELTYPTGAHTSTLVIEWGPSALAIAGLTAAVASLWIWRRLRATHSEAQ